MSVRLSPFVCLALLLAGCGSGRLPVHVVQGQVLDGDGKPAAGAKLVFHPLGVNAANSARPVGVVDEQGNFQLTTYEKGDGAPAGEYAVTVEWRPRRAPFEPQPPDKLGNRYASREKTPLKATVADRPTTLEPFRVN